MSGYDPNQSMLPASGGGNIVPMSGGGLLFANGGGPTIAERKDAFGRKITSDLQGRARRTQKLASVVSKIGKRGLGQGNGTKRAPPTRITRSTPPLSITKSTTPVASTALAQVAPQPASNLTIAAEAAQTSTSMTPVATLYPLTGTSNPSLSVYNPTATEFVSETAPSSATALSAFNPTTAPVTASLPKPSPIPQIKPDSIDDILTTLIGSPSEIKDSYTPEEQDAILKTLIPLLTSDAEKKFEIKMNKITMQE